MAKETEDLVTFNVGGECFQVPERIIRAKGDTLLTTLLDDPARGTSTSAIYVNGNPKLFPLIWDWFRFEGSIVIPASVSLPQMRRECAFYQLPDDVTIKRERVADVMAELNEETRQSLRRATENVQKRQQTFKAAGVELAAAKVYEDMLKSICGEQKWTTTKLVQGLPSPQNPPSQALTSGSRVASCPSWGQASSCGWQGDLCSSCCDIHMPIEEPIGIYLVPPPVHLISEPVTTHDSSYEWFKSERQGDIKTVMARVSELAAADGWEFTATAESQPTGTLKLPPPQAQA